jgi:Fic family protein
MVRKRRKPPPLDGLPAFLVRNAERLPELIEFLPREDLDTDYLHWDDLQRRPLPAGVNSHDEWWYLVKMRRIAQGRQLPLCDHTSGRFWLSRSPLIDEGLRDIDLHAAGQTSAPTSVLTSRQRDRYLKNSLMEEAIRSSQLEGAATTRKVAREMISSGRSASNVSEQMILNNYHLMQEVLKLQKEPMSKDLVLHLHRIAVQGTLEDGAGGRFRRTEDKVTVVDHQTGEPLYVPPPAEQLPERLAVLCDFANEADSTPFLHPVLRSIVLHFWLAYDHPFVDGNGRTARALTYWSMLRHGYWLFEFVSISQRILRARAQYARAFLYTETDHNDITYFVVYHLRLIRQALRDLYDYLQRKDAQVQLLNRHLRIDRRLNHRQRALLTHALRHPGFVYTIPEHAFYHSVNHETARKDLQDLRRRGILEASKSGRSWEFRPPVDLEARLSGADRPEES